MLNVAFVPVRGGSKSIPLKNIKLFASKPLVYWSLMAANECSDIAVSYVSTDSDEIANTVSDFNFDKVRIVRRSTQSATDTASTETAMLEFAEGYEFENICLIQATSPLITSADLAEGFKALRQADSVLSVVRQKRFIWESDGEFFRPLNYDYNMRPRRQEFDGFLVENGAFYITSRVDLLRTKCRISGRISIVEMSADTYFEIDELNDWIVAEQLMNLKESRHK